jgi:hypothetical protein
LAEIFPHASEHPLQLFVGNGSRFVFEIANKTVQCIEIGGFWVALVFGSENLHCVSLEGTLGKDAPWPDKDMPDEVIKLALFIIGKDSWRGRAQSTVHHHESGSGKEIDVEMREGIEIDRCESAPISESCVYVR